MSYRQALEEIATGYIVGEKTNYKNTVDVMRSIAKEALETPQIKELSDDEIKEVIRKHWNKELGNRGMLALCKAILKKANEK